MDVMGTAWIEDNYRYSLTRRWADGPTLVVIMLNPSTATAEKPDPTLHRCIHFASFWRYSGLIVVNPFAWRSPTPKALLEAQDPIGPKCDLAIEQALNLGSMYLCAWGNPPNKCPAIVDRMRAVERRIIEKGKICKIPVACLGRTMFGHPKHPLARGVHRVPDHQQPLIYTGAAA